MSNLKELMAGLASMDVPFEPLGTLVTNLDSQRRPVTRSDRKTGEYPYYGANGVQDYVDDYIFDGTFLLMGEDGSVIRPDGTPVLNWATGKVWVNNHAHVLQPKNERLNLRFLFHYLQTVDISSFVTGGTQLKLNQGNMNRILVPVPPISAQEAIAGALDNFTELETELGDELAARRHQYGYYLDSLLSFSVDSGVPWSTLGAISKRVSSGATPLAGSDDYYNGGTIPWLRTQEVRFVDIWDTEVRITEKALKETAAKWIPADCVIVAISGATAGRSAINRIPLATNQHCCNFEIDPAQADYRYVFYWVRSQYEQIKLLGQGARSDLNVTIIKNVRIPLPPIAEQKRIASVLGTFDALVNDTAVGLPAEIEARQKQYRHYRNRLMAFKEKVA